ncbi:MAG: hypothetical protein ABI416_11405 [Ginsengibacter sp.]
MTGKRKIQENVYNKKISKALDQFWIGFVIYTTCYMLMISSVVHSKITYLQLLGIVLFTLPAFQLIRFKIENAYLRTLFIIYFAWQLYTVSRGFKFNKDYLFGTFVEAYGGVFVYLAPLIVLFPKDLIYLKKIINVILALSIIYLICDVVFIKALLGSGSETGQTIIEYFSKIMGIPCGFILLTLVYNNDKRKSWAIWGKLWALFVVVLTFLLAAIRARRGLMFMSVNILVFTYILYNYAYKTNMFFKFFPLVIVFFVSIYAMSVFSEKSKTGSFSLITQRLKEDTRSDVEKYFYLDMSKKDWVVGKGIDGMYWCPTGATPDGYRLVIETDYLQIMLKGGAISLGLLFLIAIPAVLLGLFYSDNILSKAAACWILLWFLALFPATVTTFSMNYLLVWISIGICYSKKIRKMPEETVKELFQYKIF